jgi:tRNA threonylcarbamoyladenosine biosynthesis protein TsaB
MLFAAIETSGDWCSVALWRDGEIAALERRAPNRHSELALPMLEDLFEKTKSNARELDAIAFGAGPGSFTGLRIACGLAQGLAFARDLPVIGISSFEAIAQEAASGAAPESGAARIVACIDARMREVYYSALEKRGGPQSPAHSASWREVVPGQCVAPQDAPPPPGEGWTGCGSGFQVYPEFLSGKILRKKPEIHPTALAVAQLAAPRLAAGEGVDAALAVPVYLRDKIAFTRQELENR